jgi:hypothetical protein
VVKNLFELKNARRVLVEGNVLENSLERRAGRLCRADHAAQPGRQGAMVDRRGRHVPLQRGAPRRERDQHLGLGRSPGERAGAADSDRQQPVL